MKIILLATLLAVSTPVFAQAPAATSPLAARLGDPEKKFIKDFTEQHLFEQELVNKAKAKDTANPIGAATGALYKKVMGDLGKSWTEFATLTQEKKVEITTTAKTSDRAAATAVGKLDGVKFEKEFVKVLGKEAKHTDTLLTTAEKSVRDAEVKAFIEKWAPAFKAHLTEIDAAEKGLKGK